MNTYWISLPCDLLSSLASFQCSLLHHLHLSSDLGLSKYVNQHSHLNLSRNVRLSVLYDLDFNISWDPSDPEDFRLLQKYEESDGSIAYLPNNLAKNLVSLWDFMNLLMKKVRPDGENNKLYYLMDEQWTKFTAYDMRSALIDEKQNSHMSPAKRGT